MTSKLVRDKKTNALINTNEEQLKSVLAARQTAKTIGYHSEAIEAIQKEVELLRADIKRLQEERK